MLLHALPPLLPDDAGADEYVVLERHAGSQGANFLARGPIFLIEDNQDVYVRPRLAVSAGL